MFEKILYPTDFSDVSKKALEYIKELKQSGLKEVIILHVIDSRILEASHGYLSGKSFDEFKSARYEDTIETLYKIEEELKNEGLEVKTRIEQGIPLQEILRVEAEENISAIVIGSHGMSNIKEMFLGSVSEKVIRKCKRPVLVVKRS
ncbi:universal stress protein [Thermodesulfobacteriota bacterium]